MSIELTQIEHLERLARAATQTALSDHALFSPTRVAAHNRAVADLCDAMTGERVLQLLDVIEAAKAIDYEMFNGMTPSVGSANKLKRTLAVLDKEQT
jgi:hypothetical protein